ncbi:hypothetical protein C7W88_13750 [Novosphingobium sp. THN1]|jgi:hypothetical protein|uniref:hypothetical protein n=1 Tax=unclassified Novosphingobium TaxID=2644732 RepID=UPI000E4E6752|nr:MULTISPECIES: hypothetical protein [unclassified Novosphingobium]AXU19853.1 hypothetical protein C7W88_13750 [Novosphingobium sp. THN1]NLR38398.1 hypothetical protein [Novosphingobium sp. ERW19]
MRKLFAVAVAGIAVLGWSSQGIANPDPHPTSAPHDDHKKDKKDEHHDEHKDGEHKEEHKPAH